MIVFEREVYNRTNYDAIQRAFIRWEQQEHEKKTRGDMETGRKGLDKINLVTGCVFACGEGEDVVLGEHLS
jgi:hypothetical protein